MENPLKTILTRITENRHTYFNDLALNNPSPLATVSLPPSVENALPLNFISPVSASFKPDRLVIVHPEVSSKSGGLFGWTRIGIQRPHKGIDIEALENTRVMASERGTVSFSGNQKGYGNVVYVDHPHGYQTRYAHLNKLDVKKGDDVLQGQTLGESGKTGNADHPKILPHLHFEVLKKNEKGAYEPQDPIGYISSIRPDRRLHLILEGIQSGDL